MKDTKKQEISSEQQLEEIKEKAKVRETAIRQKAKIKLKEAVSKEKEKVQQKVQQKVELATEKIKKELKKELKKEFNDKLTRRRKKRTEKKQTTKTKKGSKTNLGKGIVSKNSLPSKLVRQMATKNTTSKILLVDDKPKALSEALPLFGYDVDVVKNGIEALHALSNTAVRYDLVLLDLMMPHMNGWETLKAIRNNKRLEDMPVIMVTAANEEQQQIFGLKYGADDYIVKPFLLPNLLARMEALLRRANWKKTKNINVDLTVIQDGIEALTKKEKQILNLLADGLTNKEIAQKFKVKDVTIKTHLNNIFKKLQVTTRTQAVLIAIQLQLQNA